MEHHDTAAAPNTTGPGDTEEEQRERYRELLEELRTIIPGVQVLFAFLLTVPFSNRFEELDDLGEAVFMVSLALVAGATVVLLTPAAYHRVAPRRDRQARVRLGTRTTVVGMALLAAAVSCALFVVARFVLADTSWGASFAAGAAVGAGTLWFALPASRRRRT